MAQRNKEHRDKHDPNKQGDKDKNNNANKREMFIRVPSNDVRVMPGAQVYLNENAAVEVVSVRRESMPVTRHIDLDIIEVKVTSGPYKGGTMFYPYPAGADIRLALTPELKFQARVEKIKSWLNPKTWLSW